MIKVGLVDNRIVTILAPFLIGALLFWLSRPLFVGALVGDQIQEQYTDVEIEIGTKKGENGFRQIKYKIGNSEVFITEENYPNADPVNEGETIVWMAQIGQNWHIFYYDFISNEKIQLTTSGNNVNPDISGNYVVWEGQVDGVWQIFLFDGLRIRQITDSELPNQDVRVNGAYVIFTRKTLGGIGWHVYLYNIETEETVNLTPDSYGGTPDVVDEVASWGATIGGEYVVFSYDILANTTARSDGVPIESVFDEVAYQEFLQTLEATSTPEATTSTEVGEGVGVLLETVDITDVEEELGIPLDVDAALIEEEIVVESTPSAGETDLLE